MKRHSSTSTRRTSAKSSFRPETGGSDVSVSARVFKALGDENRLRTVLALREVEELCVCQIVALLDLAPSTVSRHLQILKEAGLVASRKKGRWVHCRLAESAPETLGSALSRVADSRAARTDRKRLREIMRIDPDQLCELQKRS
jgi:DNA-binding transcriptional ArsR family regulator